jgi:hypothetical protein
MRSLLVILLAAAPLAAQAPQYTADGELRLPENYREWVFVGSSLGMSYNEPGHAPPKREFHHIYLAPDAYRHYRRTGDFPKQTVLMMEVYSAGSHESINRQGNFSRDFLRVEAAVKDADRFPETWRYFDFSGPKPKATSTAYEQDKCWKCHNEHGATDNVFTQFYPLLRKPE